MRRKRRTWEVTLMVTDRRPEILASTKLFTARELESIIRKALADKLPPCGVDLKNVIARDPVFDKKHEIPKCWKESK